jgi:DNA-binding NarL/FixJ family response regulator
VPVQAVSQSSGLNDRPRVRIAIVDDHSVIAEGLSRIFSSEVDMELAGTAVTIAEAVTLIERKLPDVVLMDYSLPDGTGAEATERILARWPATKILMLSGSEDPKVLTSAFESGCIGFIGKTRPWNEIVTAVRAASRGESVMRAEDLTGLLGRLKRQTKVNDPVLTTRESEILGLLAKGRTTESISTELFLSPHTVRNHIGTILSKLGAHSKLEAVAISVRDGIISLDDFG